MEIIVYLCHEKRIWEMAHGYCQVYYDRSNPYFYIRRDRPEVGYLCWRYYINIINSWHWPLARPR